MLKNKLILNLNPQEFEHFSTSDQMDANGVLDSSQNPAPDSSMEYDWRGNENGRSSPISNDSQNDFRRDITNSSDDAIFESDDNSAVEPQSGDNPFGRCSANTSFIHSYRDETVTHETLEDDDYDDHIDSIDFDAEVPLPPPDSTQFRYEDEDEDIYGNFSAITSLERIKIEQECARKPVLVLTDQRLHRKDNKSSSERPPDSPRIRPNRIAPAKPRAAPPQKLVKENKRFPTRSQSIFGGIRRENNFRKSDESPNSPNESPMNTLPLTSRDKRTSLLQRRFSSYNTEQMDKHEREYHYAICEFIDKVESTIQTLEELDNFYSKLGNTDQFKEIIDSWPQIHRSSLPAIISVHHRFIARSGASGNDIFTNQTNRK